MFEYTIFIMLLPLLSFIVLGLAGMKMQPVWRMSIRRMFLITSLGCLLAICISISVFCWILSV